MMARRRLAVAALCAAILAFVGHACVRQPAHAFLIGHGAAEWIRVDRPFSLEARRLATETARFQVDFDRPERLAAGDPARLRVQALRAFEVFLNGHSMGGGSAPGASWRRPVFIDLAPRLVAGRNRLEILVANDRGSPLLLAEAPGLDLATGLGWRVRDESQREAAAGLARDRRNPVGEAFPSAWQGLRANWLTLAAAFAAGIALHLACARWNASRGEMDPWRVGPGHLRWLLIATLAAIGLHDLPRLPLDTGFDADGHYDYIRYLVQRGRLPLATEGWQMFQAPLFHLVAALPYALITAIASEPVAMRAIRLIPLACGLGLVEWVYRAARQVFPEREDLQWIAVASGGLLPMVVYMSSYVGNEPLAALLSAVLLVGLMRLVADPHPRLAREGCRLGSIFGLALLAKVSAALLLPLVGVALLRAAGSRRDRFAGLLGFGAVSGALAGWYFLRNWILLGTPYLGGWDPARGIAWIQDPGYRVPADLFGFGAALHQPVYAGLLGFWDGVYSSLWLDGLISGKSTRAAAPPWDLEAMAACALWAVPLALAGLIGAVRSLRRPAGATQGALLGSTAAIGIYLTAMLSLHLRLPVSSTVKSSYMLGLAPCFGLLIAWGCDLLPRRPVVQSLLAGHLAAWLVLVSRSYWA
jgi:hypothetical protein